MNPLQALERYAKRRLPQGERCELCAAPIGETHPHVVELAARSIRCACHPCSVLFRSPEAGGGRYRTVPDRVLVDEGLRIPAETWEAFSIPVRLAFLFKNRDIGKWDGVYPSPAGPTEVVLDGEPARLGPSPLFEAVEDDVEALLFYGRRGAENLECILAPIDRCYELVGLVRSTYRGFDGGDAREIIEDFVAALKNGARIVERSER